MRSTLPTFLSGVILGLILLSFPGNAEAQFKASVQGTVTDTAGAIVPDANVTLTNTETSQSETTTTSDGGFYRFSGLAPGIYTLTVEKESFKKRVVNDVKVDAEAVQGVDIQLEAGVITEVVTVSAENVGLETEDPNIRKTITNEEVLLLPQAGRDPYQLARLTPGVFGDGARAANGSAANLPNTSGPGGSNIGIFATENQVQISANGQRLSANNIQLDGTSVNSQTWGGAAVITPSQESVKEVQVTSSTYSAEDGRNSGAQIKVVTQNGTNDFHGSAFLKINDPALNAFNKFHGVSGVVPAVPTRVEEKFKTFGGSLGGPILHERLFFFFSYEGLRNNTNNTFTSLVDTPQFRQSIITARPNTLTARILSSAGVEPRILQTLPITCATAALSVPCQDVTGGLDIGSPGGVNGQYLQSTNPSGGGFDGIPDLQFAELPNPSSFRGHQFFTRIDYNLSANDRLAFSSYFTPVTSTTSDRAAQSRPQADINSNRFSYAIGFIYGRNISSTMLNEARFNITRWGFDELT
ncbi:MAG TPA: carboxypeptidase-like regulatory domain-containing protein, partial [Pyrinomonadaceae bacterium]|nr:carboxypeptidase-like regulatory domain-containing protein [Pyrinomonadaceae bacterium]